ncbi:hypothetical protein [Candidatus Bartonella washoeensis]|uniref:Uncharacterized protein n=1 Tax=Cardidatus Bartonella washoeensis 085-0475 TaxID=1094564 RepID=J0QSW7_9HYPH|nr:hypothetical protein [Bartonella washoeensis]EJF86194.1 hypothetical protein MCW_00090 [Bartonella washoeensis 085-0475]
MSKDQYEMGKINCRELCCQAAVWMDWFWRLGGGHIVSIGGGYGYCL